MNVGELKEFLNGWDDNTLIYMEHPDRPEETVDINSILVMFKYKDSACKLTLALSKETVAEDHENDLKNFQPDDLVKRRGSMTQKHAELIHGGYSPWFGGLCPEDEETYVEVKFRNGNISRGQAGDWVSCWIHTNPNPNDIIGYKRVQMD